MATTFRSKKNWPLGVGSLNADINSSTLTIVLSSGQGSVFPASNFTVTIDEEIILIDSRSTDTLTVNASGRGYDSSTASAHAAGTAVTNYQIVKDFTDLETAVNTIENKIDGTNPIAGDDVYLKYGADSDIKFGYDETTNDRGEWRDASNNVLAYVKDLGTTGCLGATGRVETPQVGTSADNDLLQLASNLLTVNGAITAADDTDTTFILGRTRLHSATSDRAQFAHRDRSASNQYALSHLSGGDTQLNATTSLTLQINASTKATLTATDFAIGSASTDTMTMTSRFLVRTVTDAGPMTATGGTQREIVWNTSDAKLYVCTVAHASAATWVALH